MSPNNSRSFNLPFIRVLTRAMAAFSLLVLAFGFSAVVSASPRNHIARGQGGNASPDGELGLAGYPDRGSWDSKTDDWGSASQYGGSRGHSSTVDYPGSQYGMAEVADGDTGQRVQSLLLLRFLLHKWLDQPFTSQAPATLLPCPQRLYTSLAQTTLPTSRHLLLPSRVQCRLRSRPHSAL